MKKLLFLGFLLPYIATAQLVLPQINTNKPALIKGNVNMWVGNDTLVYTQTKTGPKKTLSYANNLPVYVADIVSLTATPGTRSLTVFVQGGAGGIFSWKSSGSVDNISTFSAAGGGIWERKYDDAVYPEWGGADISIDDSPIISRMFNAMLAQGKGTLRLTKTYRISTPISVTITGNVVGPITIEGGGKIVVDPGVDFLSVSVSANSLFRLLHIQNLNIQGGRNAIKLDGGPAGNQFSYRHVLENIEINGCTGYGVWITGNTFESDLVNVNVISASTTQDCFFLDASNLAGGAIGSIELVRCKTNGGLHGIGSAGAVTDINIWGGTYLSSQREGIALGIGTGGFCYKAMVVGTHIEDCWKSVTTLSAGGGGINIVGCCTIEGVIVYSEGVHTNGTYSMCKYAVDLYVVGASHAVLINPQISGMTGNVQKPARLGGQPGKVCDALGVYGNWYDRTDTTLTIRPQ